MTTNITVFEGGPIDLPPGQVADRAKVRLLGTTVGGRSAFSVRRGVVHAGEFAGAVDMGSIRVEVLPKPFNVQEIERARSLLLNLLHWGGGDARVGWLPGQSATSNMDILQVVERQAVTELLERLQMGSPRRYEPIEEVSSVIRGRILFSRYARQLPSDAHRMPIRSNPLTIDNDLARLLKSLTAFLWSRSRSYNVRRDLDRCLDLLQSVEQRQLMPELVQRVRLGRLESEWRRLVDLAGMLASGHSPDPTRLGGSSQPTLLFPLNRLFEITIRRVLARNLPAPLACTLAPGALRLLTNPETSADALSIKPDLIFRHGQAITATGDAKWKVLTADGPRHGASPNDVYQLLTYMRRAGVFTGILFYPRADWMPESWTISFEIEPERAENITIISVDIESIVSRNTATRKAAQKKLVDQVMATLAGVNPDPV